jgi:hypothetical protein
MILFIAQEYNNYFGGGVISHRNMKICQEVFGIEQTKVYLLPPKNSGGITTLKSFISGNLMGYSLEMKKRIINYIKENSEIRYIFIDNSMLGKLAKSLKKTFPNLHIITFFHNVELVFFSRFLWSTRKYHHTIGLLPILYNEKQAIKYSDTIITLNSRDSETLVKTYGRSANLLLPTSFEDNFDESKVANSGDQPTSLLFVGSRFYPHEQGIIWFINNVMPFITNVSLKVLGRNFEMLSDKWNKDNIQFIGSCSDLSSFYYNADIVIAPIFTGSGMKTKTAEALMYGKTILATSEAFEGYSFEKYLVGKECNTAKEYIDFINNYKPGPQKFNLNARSIFKKYYSHSSVSNQLREYLSNI